MGTNYNATRYFLLKGIYTVSGDNRGVDGQKGGEWKRKKKGSNGETKGSFGG